MRYQLPVAALIGILLYLHMQWHEGQDWAVYSSSHDCRLTETKEGNHWASVGLNDNPRIGTSTDKELWVCSDGTRHWHDKLQAFASSWLLP